MSEQFEYTHVNGVVSEALSLVAFNEQDGQMFVRFTNGNERVYIDVPKAEYDGLVEADSVGRYYNYEIYGQYDSTPVEDVKLVKAAVKAEEPEVEKVDLLDDPWATKTDVEAFPAEEATVAAGIQITTADSDFFIPNARIDIPKSKFGIRWTVPGTHLSSEPVYEAVDANTALRDFQNDANTFLGPDVQVKVTAVVHYFD